MDPFWGNFGPKWTKWTHRWAHVLNIFKCRLHREILPGKINFNCKSPAFGSISLRSYSNLANSGYFGPKGATWRHRWAHVLNIFKCQCYHWLLRAIVSLSAKFQLLISLPLGVILTFDPFKLAKGNHNIFWSNLTPTDYLEHLMSLQLRRRKGYKIIGFMIILCILHVQYIKN